jgi:hypothetical protein
VGLIGNRMRATFVFLGLLLAATIGPSRAQDAAPVSLGKCFVENRLEINRSDAYDMQLIVDFTNNSKKTATIVRIDVFVIAGTHYMIWPRHPGPYIMIFGQTGNFAPGVPITRNEFDFLRGDLAKGETFGDFACAVTYVQFRDGTSWRESSSVILQAMDAFAVTAKPPTLPTPHPNPTETP